MTPELITVLETGIEIFGSPCKERMRLHSMLAWQEMIKSCSMEWSTHLTNPRSLLVDQVNVACCLTRSGSSFGGAGTAFRCGIQSRATTFKRPIIRSDIHVHSMHGPGLGIRVGEFEFSVGLSQIHHSAVFRAKNRNESERKTR